MHPDHGMSRLGLPKRNQTLVSSFYSDGPRIPEARRSQGISG